MIKSELVQKIATSNPHLYHRDVERIVNVIFDEIVDQFRRLLPDATLHAIPLSALHGDNVIEESVRTPWFEGLALLPYLETIQVDRSQTLRAFRFPVQLVVRPDHAFRGYAGQIVSGTIRPGDEVTVWPSNRATTVKRIVTWGGDLDEARAPMSVTLVLADEIDISRGDLIAVGAPEVGQRFTADLVWMDERPLDPNKVYLLKHSTKTVSAEIDHAQVLHQSRSVTARVGRPSVIERYAASRAMGSVVVIDPATNFTAGAGMMAEAVSGRHSSSARPNAAQRLARLARAAAPEAEAEEAVRQALDQLLT